MYLKTVKKFIIRNLPASVRERIVEMRNLGREIPQTAIIHGCKYNVKRNKFWLKFNSGLWEPDLRNFFQQHVSDKKIVLDIGAWQGSSMFVACSLNPKKVISVEANLDSYNILEENVFRNGLDDMVEIHNICLSERDGDTVLFGSMDDHVPHSAIHGIDGSGHKMTTTSFLAFLKKYPIESVNIIKIDIEGGERFLIEGLQYISTFPGIHIYLALHPPFWPDKRQTAKSMIEVLKNFDLFSSKNEQVSFSELERLMLSNEKTHYPNKTGRFFDIILKTKVGDE